MDLKGKYRMKKFSALCLFIMLFFFLTACKKQEEGVTVYTDEDIYIYSSECGYRCGYWGDYEVPRECIVIETAEQLEYAVQKRGLTEIFGGFRDMIESYPIEEYTYMLEYDEVSSGGYYIHADKVEVRKDRVSFGWDSKSHGPKGDATQEMGGFLHMAAIPKEYLKDCNLSEMYGVYQADTAKDPHVDSGRKSIFQNIAVDKFRGFGL